MLFTWHTQNDGKVCPICQPLHEATWTFDTKLDRQFPRLLIHPVQGTVWDVDADEPRTHGDNSFNCRCWLSVEVDWSDIRSRILTKIKQVQLEHLALNEVWKGTGPVRVVREQGRFVTWQKR